MRKNWELIILGNLLSQIKGGGTPSKSKTEYWNGNIPWCSVKDMSDDKFRISKTEDFITKLGLEKSSSNLIPKGTVITSTRMGLGRAFINDIDMAINQDLKALYPNELLDNNFLLWLIIFNRNKIESLGTGSTVKGIRLETLKALEVWLPPLPTQRKIAAILSAYDDLIENNLKRIKLLEEKAQLTYEEWFVRMKFPGYESMVFEEVNLNDLALYFGRGVTPQYEEGSGFWGINQKANKGSNLEKSHFKEYKKGDWVPLERFAKNGDVLLNSLGEGTIGRCHYYKWESDVYPVDQHMTIFRGKSPEISLFIYHLLASEQGQGILNSLKKGGTNMTMLNIGDLRTIKVNVPIAEILWSFYEKVEILFNQKSNLEYQNQLLKEARDILLPRLMTGMIDVDALDLSAFEQGDQEEMLMAAEPKSEYR